MKWGLAKRDRNPDTAYSDFRKDIDRVFDDFFSLKPSSLFDSEWLPSFDVDEDDKAIHIRAELPGIDEKDLKVNLENNILTISGEKKDERTEEDKDKRTVVSERKFGSFSRSLSVPEGIKAEKIRAKFKDGVLSIEVPKDEAVQAKKIKIDVK